MLKNKRTRALSFFFGREIVGNDVSINIKGRLFNQVIFRPYERLRWEVWSIPGEKWYEHAYGDQQNWSLAGSWLRLGTLEEAQEAYARIHGETDD